LKKLGSSILIVLFFLFSAMACFVMDIYVYGGKSRSADSPGSADSLRSEDRPGLAGHPGLASHPGLANAKKKIINIEPGLGVGALSKRLHNSDIIKYPTKFRLFARIKGYDKRLKTGEYILSPTMSPISILEKIVSGRVQLYRLTVPEGYNIRQIATLVAKAKLGDKGDFLAVAEDARFVREEGLTAESFEGYLFPDTYYFPKDATPEKIISTMIKGFRSVFGTEWKNRAEHLGFSIHQVVILASIVEKETGAHFERPIISSVFHNRLKKRMRLESDPTVIYGIKNYDGNIKRKHLSTPTPYNTYMKKGLPVGPIANPGLKSIEAVLYPADTQLLYFVSKRNGTHQFSTNIKDHINAVRKYQLSK